MVTTDGDSVSFIRQSRAQRRAIQKSATSATMSATCQPIQWAWPSANRRRFANRASIDDQVTVESSSPNR